MKTIKLLAIACISAITFASCSDDNPAPTNEEEIITTMRVTLTPVGGGNDIVIESKDLDGDGPDAPDVTQNITLSANTTYNASIVLLNETESPAENITTEVAAEAEEHQFFYTASGINPTFTYKGALDANNNPVGINFTLESGAAGTGTITITLRHEPNKDAAGVSDGNITNAGGETDIEVTFDITIQGTVIAV